METTGPETRWLDEDESLAWRSMVALCLLVPGPLDVQLQRDHGISLFEYLVLSYLSMAPDRRLRMSELGALSNGSPSRLSNVVKRLERHGWVERERDPQDGRSTLATLTEPGWQLVVAAAPGHVEAVRHYVIDPLTRRQLAALHDIGERVRPRLTESRFGAH